jgi:hypothetical protein
MQLNHIDSYQIFYGLFKIESWICPSPDDNIWEHIPSFYPSVLI